MMEIASGTGNNKAKSDEQVLVNKYFKNITYYKNQFAVCY